MSKVALCSYMFVPEVVCFDASLAPSSKFAVNCGPFFLHQAIIALVQCPLYGIVLSGGVQLGPSTLDW